MPTTLTLKNIPDEIYAKLKAAAEQNRRSLNSEIIVCLETVLKGKTVAATERVARARALRQALRGKRFSAKEIDATKRAGRA